MPPFVNNHLPQITLLSSPDWQDYELLDSGNGLKLERFGPYRLVRPEAEAIWSPALPGKDWKSAHAVFTPSPEENGGHWRFQQEMPNRWSMDYKGLRFWAQLTTSRHVGVFPEQAAEWDWISQQMGSFPRPLKVLNLFGYTALATLAAARQGAQVTHVDASPKVVSWAKENQLLSGLGHLPIRWIVDDVLKFVQRESRRGSDQSLSRRARQYAHDREPDHHCDLAAHAQLHLGWSIAYPGDAGVDGPLRRARNG
jgi:23S rRNA (cytosine1962-C5)-methyltransferase